MFLHLGNDKVIPLRDVISIHNYQGPCSDINNEFIQMMKEEHMIVDISDNNPKSFVITDKIVYVSTISSMTLKKRSSYNGESDNE